MEYVQNCKAGRILEYYGDEHQKLKAAEELSELETVLLQNINKGVYCKEQIAEEIADVYIMLKQLTLIYGIEDYKLSVMVDFKLNRQLERIIKEKEGNND